MDELQPYRHLLDDLPGVSSYRTLKDNSGHHGARFDGRLSLRTDAGDRDFLVEVYRSHLTQHTANHIAEAAGQSGERLLILAPHVGAGLAAILTDAGVNYLDANGNCHIAAPPLYIHVEGKAAPARPAAAKGIRSAGYQVLFTYLAHPTLLDEPLRTVAEWAGVSRQPVADMRNRLLSEGYALATKTKTAWHPRRRQDALGLWLHGYESTVRPSLVWGTYRTQERDPLALEQTLTRAFDESDGVEFRWGGNAAGFRLTGHYRGDRTVVHLRSLPADLPRRVRALGDPGGNLIVMDAFGTINWSHEGQTVHPLLVYSEMLSEGSERAREAAEDVYDMHLAPIWEEAP